MSEPVEIRPGDIIPRPLTLGSVTGKEAVKKTGIIQQVKDGIQQFKEIKQLCSDLGIDLGEIMGGKKPDGGPGIGGMPPPPALTSGQPPPQATAGKQIKGILTLLTLKYGDVSLAECLEKLRADYGEKKLSDFLRSDLIK